MSSPCASSAFAFTNTSNAVSVPSRVIRLASRSSRCAVMCITAIIARQRNLSFEQFGAGVRLVMKLAGRIVLGLDLLAPSLGGNGVKQSFGLPLLARFARHW